MTTNFSITKADLLNAKKSIEPYIHNTPILTNSYINDLVGAQVFFKCENLQKVGAFKMRGASYAISNLSPEEKAKGITTHSSGNHAQAVALAAKLMGIKAQVVMPRTAPKIKVAAVKSYGATVHFCEPNIQARQESVDLIIKRDGAVFIPPYDHPDIIAGQATCGMELLESYPNLDSIICPVGGGGLVSGSILAAHYFSPKTKVYGAEPEGADDAYQSIRRGKRLTEIVPKSIADGLLTHLGELNFEVINQGVCDIFLVSDAEIIEAMRIIWERMKIIIEPSCATPLAAIIKNKAQFKGQQLGVILSGGNVDLDSFFKSYTSFV